MEWTKEWPKEDGHYWIICSYAGACNEVVEVMGGCAYATGCDRPSYPENMNGAMFYGPIEPPPLPRKGEER